MQEQTKYKLVVVGPRWNLRLRDLNDMHVLEITCYQCNHKAVVSAMPLKSRFGEHEWIKHLERHMRCKKCGNSLTNTWKIGQVEE